MFIQAFCDFVLSDQVSLSMPCALYFAMTRIEIFVRVTYAAAADAARRRRRASPHSATLVATHKTGPPNFGELIVVFLGARMNLHRICAQMLFLQISRLNIGMYLQRNTLLRYLHSFSAKYYIREFHALVF